MGPAATALMRFPVRSRNETRRFSALSSGSPGARSPSSGGSGVLVCLPENPTEDHLVLLLDAARARYRENNNQQAKWVGRQSQRQRQRAAGRRAAVRRDEKDSGNSPGLGRRERAGSRSPAQREPTPISPTGGAAIPSPAATTSKRRRARRPRASRRSTTRIASRSSPNMTAGRPDWSRPSRRPPSSRAASGRRPRRRFACGSGASATQGRSNEYTASSRRR